MGLKKEDKRLREEEGRRLDPFENKEGRKIKVERIGTKPAKRIGPALYATPGSATPQIITWATMQMKTAAGIVGATRKTTIT